MIGAVCSSFFAARGGAGVADTFIADHALADGVGGTTGTALLAASELCVGSSLFLADVAGATAVADIEIPGVGEAGTALVVADELRVGSTLYSVGVAGATDVASTEKLGVEPALDAGGHDGCE
jgi:hypothetical protein